MAQNTRTKTTYETTRVIQPIYTRGNIALSQDGHTLASCLDEDVVLTDLRTGEELARIEGDGEIVTALAITPTASHVILCSRSLSMRIFALTSSDSFDQRIECELLRTLKPHTAPVVVVDIDSTGTLLATGGADGVVKVWDIRAGYTTHTFHGHSGVISALHFFQQDIEPSSTESTSNKRKRKSEDATDLLLDDHIAAFRLASGGEDGKVRIWDLNKRKSVATLDSHVSVVRSVDYCPITSALLTASRDKTAIIWSARTWKVQSTLPVLEEVECAGFLEDGRYMYIGGETARVRIWSLERKSEITEEQPAGTETEAIQQIIHHPNLSFLLVVQADQTLLLYSITPLKADVSDSVIPPLPLIRRICGTHGQVVDIAYVGREKNLLALATNVEDVRIVDIAAPASGTRSVVGFDGSYFGADVAVLKGHDELIICMDVDWSGHWLATGAKDNTARLWRLDPAMQQYDCYTILRGHAESLGAIALPHAVPPSDSAAYKSPLDHPPAFIMTGSQDQTIKRWEVARTTDKTKSTKAVYTRKAHDKDINALTIDSKSQFFASASQDRTVKIWSIEYGETIGVLRGHKRGVWSVAFSPQGTNLQISGAASGSSARGYIVTGSGDKTVKIWSLSDYSCLVTLEGHTNSVLKVLWMPPISGSDKSQASHDRRGPLVASAGGDGLVKVWEVNSGECVSTLDNHEDRVWALAARPASAPTSTIEESLVSGSGDGVITFWKDTTSETLEEVRAKESERIEMDQKLMNYVHGGNWREAIVLALQLDQPGRLLHLFKTVIENEDFDRSSNTGNKEVDQVIASLSDTQLYTLLLRCRDWNTNARTAIVAQRILRAVTASFSMDRLANLKVGKVRKGGGLKEILEGLRVYGERHFQRITDLWDESFLVEFTLREMDEYFGPDMVTNGLTNGTHATASKDTIMIE